MKELVSVIIPCRNEANTIRLLLAAIEAQTVPKERLEVVVADGMSTDGTRAAIAAFAGDHPDLAIRVVDNHERSIPAALNRAIEVSRGEFVIRLDAHSVPQPDYVERCLAALKATGAANVGGAWEIRPSGEGWIARAIAAAAAHPLGAGDARYRYGGKPGAVDTVPFGAFPRAWLERVGRFDESLLTNEDYELNLRLRQAGGTVWYDPAIRSTYFARADMAALARQYWRYGYWKAQMLRRYPGSLRWRQLLPPLFVLTLLILLAAAAAWPPARWLLALQLVAYVGATAAAGIVAGIRRGDGLLALGFPPALWTMHLAWGGAVLWGLLRGRLTRGDRTT